MHIGHMIVSALIHALIFSTVFKAMRGVPLPHALLYAVGGIAGIAITRSIIARLFRRRF